VRGAQGEGFAGDGGGEGARGEKREARGEGEGERREARRKAKALIGEVAAEARGGVGACDAWKSEGRLRS